MPPPVPQQGSRAGLIVALVIFVILSVLFAVFFFNERGQRQKAENDLVEEQKKPIGYLPENRDAGDIKVFKDLASEQSGEGGENPTGYKKATDTLAPNAKNAFDIADGERMALIKAITPLAVNGRQAVDYIALSKNQARDILNNATTKPSIVWNQDMGRVLQEVANYAVERDREVQTVKKEVEAEKAETAKANAALTAAKGTFDAQLAVQTGQRPSALMVPRDAVLKVSALDPSAPPQNVVYTVTESRVHRQVVALGVSDGKNVEIVQGLAEGVDLVLNPRPDFLEGELITAS